MDYLCIASRKSGPIPPLGAYQSFLIPYGHLPQAVIETLTDEPAPFRKEVLEGFHLERCGISGNTFRFKYSTADFAIRVGKSWLGDLSLI